MLGAARSRPRLGKQVGVAHDRSFKPTESELGEHDGVALIDVAVGGHIERESYQTLPASVTVISGPRRTSLG